MTRFSAYLAYLILALFAGCVVSAGTLAATVTGGLVSLPAALVAAAATFQALRRLVGRVVGVTLDGGGILR